MRGKRTIWVIGLGVLYFGLIGAESCGKNARVRIDAAQDAVEQARAAEAQQYAPTEFRSAEESLLLAQDQFERRRYKRAEQSATHSEAQARLAWEKALAEKAQKEEEARRQREEEEQAALAYNVSTLYSETVIDDTADADLARAALHPIHFEFDSSELSEHAKTILAMNAEWLKRHPHIKIEIEGHCDERGSEEYNLALGARRAKTVYDYMVQLGVDPDRMRTISYGESMPVDPRSTEEAWRKNRRAHFAVIQN